MYDEPETERQILHYLPSTENLIETRSEKESVQQWLPSTEGGGKLVRQMGRCWSKVVNCWNRYVK